MSVTEKDLIKVMLTAPATWDHKLKILSLYKPVISEHVHEMLINIVYAFCIVSFENSGGWQ